MTADELRRIHAALTETNGERSLAAIKLGMLPRELKNKINNNLELRARWSIPTRPTDTVAAPVTEAEAMHKPPPQVDPNQPTPLEIESVKAMIKEDALLSRGLENLGLTDKEQQLAVELSNLHQQHFVRAHQIIKAGVTRGAIMLQTAINEAGEWFRSARAKLDETPDDKRFNVAMEVDMAARHLRELFDMVKRMGDSSDKSMLIESMVRFRLSGGEGKQKKKPGYDHELREAIESDPSGRGESRDS